jgi:hypothetical protein
MTSENERITPLLAGMRERLTQEKTVAQACAAQCQAHCPEWLEACMAPQGAKGGSAFLIETEDFSLTLRTGYSPADALDRRGTRLGRRTPRVLDPLYAMGLPCPKTYPSVAR